MNSPEPTTDPDDLPEAPRLLLVKETLPADPDPDDPVPPAEEDEGTDADADHDSGEASLLSRWIIMPVREAVAGLEIRAFLRASADDILHGSAYIPRAAGRWALAPDPATTKDAHKKRLQRSLVVLAVPGFFAYAVLAEHNRTALPLAAGAWIVACWLVADTARSDAKRRAKAKKKEAQAKKKAEQDKKAKKQAKKDKKKETAPTPDPIEVPAARPTPEQERQHLADWVLLKIGPAKGIHLDRLYALAKKEGVCPPDRTQAEFRKRMEWCGITFKQMSIQLVEGAQAVNRTGVSADDVPRA